MRLVSRLTHLIVIPCLIVGCSPGDPAESLCTEDRDVQGVLCDDRPRVDLQTAIDIAQMSPELADAALARASSRLLNPDGEAEAWELWFSTPTGLVATTVRLDSEPGAHAPAPHESTCEIGAGLTPMRSTRVVRSAIQRWEQLQGRALEVEPTTLRVVHSSACFPYPGSPADELRHVRIGAGEESWFAHFDKSNRLERFEGPCAADARHVDCGET